ncbi:hypothetical protein [Streptomyces sp. NPDC087538]|uniref:hypothetical protein n=1 Tax=Streptomyces sp. NPDC087538 TaxID=3365797 RepID=UPI0037F872E9
MITPGTAVRHTPAVGLVLAASLTTGLATPPAATAAAADAAPAAGLGRYYQQRPHWHRCAQGADDETGRALDTAGARCADVTVPLDYGKPHGRTITVAISRLKATDTRHRIGSLLINPGGPGGPGLITGLAVRPVMKKTGARYDLIGMDPRFTGRSTPLDCGLPSGPGLLSAGPDRAGFDRQTARARSVAEQCRATNGPLLPHVTTRNTAACPPATAPAPSSPAAAPRALGPDVPRRPGRASRFLHAGEGVLDSGADFAVGGVVGFFPGR